MIQAFIGAGGASGIIIVIGLAILALISVALFAGGLASALAKRPKLSLIAFALALAVGFYPFKMILGFLHWQELQKSQTRNYDVAVRLAPDGEYRVTIDGVTRPDELILLDGEIDFHIDLSHSRTLAGRSRSFQSRRKDGAFRSFDFGAIEVPHADRTAFLATLPPAPKRALYCARTDTATIRFRRVSPEFEWLSGAARTPPP